MDQCFRELVHEYGDECCREILKGEGQVRRENLLQVSPKISAYLEGLDLKGVVEERIWDDHLRAPPTKKKRSSPRIRFGAVVEGGVWGALNATDETPVKQSTTTEVETTTTTDEMDTQPTQETLDSTVSSMQSSFQQEVERANRMRKAAAEANAQSLMDMQRQVDERLKDMDKTIKIVHEGQTSNDANIQTMMTKMDLFGVQMQRLEAKLNGTPHGEEKEKKENRGNKVTPTGNATQDEANDWNEDFAASPHDFDAIMSDAESKKRTAAESSLAKAKKSKPQLAPITRSTAQGRGR